MTETKELTVQDFLDEGYIKYTKSSHLNNDCIVQKLVSDHKGKCYYIIVGVYEHYKKDYYEVNQGLHRVGFQPEVQFRQQDKPTVNVILILDKEHQIKDIEEQFQEIWISLGKPYYSEYC